jgi:hypothetical protein
MDLGFQYLSALAARPLATPCVLTLPKAPAAVGIEVALKSPANTGAAIEFGLRAKLLAHARSIASALLPHVVQVDPADFSHALDLGLSVRAEEVCRLFVRAGVATLAETHDGGENDAELSLSGQRRRRVVGLTKTPPRMQMPTMREGLRSGPEEF